MKVGSGRVRAASVIVWCCVLLVVAAIVLLALMEKPEEETPDAEEKPVAVRTMRIEARRLPDVLVVPGRLEPVSDVVVAAEKGGRIVDANLEKGDSVTEGDIIAKIDDRLWQATLNQAEIELREAVKERKRWEALKSSGAVSTSEFERIQTRLDLAEVALEQAKVHLSQCSFRCPVQGVVEDRYVDVGEYVAEGQPVGRVVDASTLKLVSDIPEKDVLAISQGDSIPFTVASLPGGAFTGKVSFVASTGSPGSNSYKTELIVLAESGRLKPGMIAELSATRRIREDAIVVPLVAVVPKKGEHIVFVSNGSRAEARSVNLETIIGREAVLSEGVEVGDKMVVEGQRTLHDGALITDMDE